MGKFAYIFGVGLAVAALGTPCARAQQQTQDQPIPAYKSPLASQADSDDANAPPQELAPDDRALTGALNLSLGVPLTNHSYWSPHIDLAETIDSQPPELGTGAGTSTEAGWTSWTTVSGGADLRWLSGRSDLTASYVGGGLFSNDGSVSNGIIQDLNLVDRFGFRRWAVTFIEQAAYTPEIPFGSGGFPGIPLPGNGALGPGAGFAPGQSIITAEGQRFMNTSLGEVDVYLTPRSSLTFFGGYSLLHFFDENLLDYGDVIGEVGYNYKLTRKDTIGVSYLYNGFSYSNFDQSITSNTIQLSYGRRITGRLAFQAGIGPQIASFNASVSGGGTGGPSTTSITNLYWSLFTSLQYQMARTGLSASYSHGVAGGSGVLAGSIADTVTGSVTRQLSRTFTGSGNLGYARNTGLGISALPGITPNQTFDYFFAGANLTKLWGRSWYMNLGYQFQYQNSDASFCVGTACATSFTRNLITFGVGWRKPPIPID
jgi:hypothetical protein